MQRASKITNPPDAISLQEVETLISVALSAAVAANVNLDVLDHLMDALRDIEKGVQRPFN